MLGMRELGALIRTPQTFLRERLEEGQPPQVLLITRVTPWGVIRPVAVFLKSALSGAAGAGVVLGLGSFALQVGTWLGLALVVPAIARQCQTTINDRQGFALITYASLPFWVVGGLYIIPEEPAFLYYWSRSLLALVGLFCLYLVRQGLLALDVAPPARLPLLAGIAAAGFLIYGVLSVMMGIMAHVLLIILR